MVLTKYPIGWGIVSNLLWWLEWPAHFEFEHVALDIPRLFDFSGLPHFILFFPHIPHSNFPSPQLDVSHQLLVSLWEIAKKAKKFLFLSPNKIADELLAWGWCLVKDCFIFCLDLDSIDEEVVDAMIMLSNFGVSVSVAIFNDRLWIAILKYRRGGLWRGYRWLDVSLTNQPLGNWWIFLRLHGQWNKFMSSDPIRMILETSNYFIWVIIKRHRTSGTLELQNGRRLDVMPMLRLFGTRPAANKVRFTRWLFPASSINNWRYMPSGIQSSTTSWGSSTSSNRRRCWCAQVKKRSKS